MEIDAVITAILSEIEATIRSVSAEDMLTLQNDLLSAKRIFIAGKGRSGLQMRAFAMRLMHLGLTVHVVDDVTTPGIGQGDLLLIGSASGHTPSLVDYAVRAKSRRAEIALITAGLTSPIVEQAATIVRLITPTPKAETPSPARSVQPMANLFEQSLGLFLDLLTMQLMETLKLTPEQMFTRHANLE